MLAAAGSRQARMGLGPVQTGPHSTTDQLTTPLLLCAMSNETRANRAGLQAHRESSNHNCDGQERRGAQNSQWESDRVRVIMESTPRWGH